MEPRILEPPVFHSPKVREIFTDGLHPKRSLNNDSNCEAHRTRRVSPSGDNPSMVRQAHHARKAGNHPRMKPRILESRVFHSPKVREKFVDGLHPKLSLNNDSNNPSTCLLASDILPRTKSPSRLAASGSASTRATTPAKAEIRYSRLENSLLSIARDYIG
jgi:hypothetical protein